MKSIKVVGNRNKNVKLMEQIFNLIYKVSGMIKKLMLNS